MATQWQGPHYLAILAAAGLAFGAGYLVAGRSRPAPTVPIATNTSNGVEPGGVDTNGQAPRGRPDENELIARNAEPEGSGETPRDMGNPGNRAQPEERRPAPPREPRESKPPPSDSAEDDEGYGPDDR